ncbi:MAG: DNA/RNA nuclease SfsA [Lachnospiraceae bacterium]|nr:DNA/RNA nuclease SfsA [Lachnospiraceae bacterium]
MKYRQIVEGIFRERPNRFIAHVEIAGKMEIVHVKNTGRCKELLQPGVRVFLEVSDNPNRKTKYDLVAVEKKRQGLPCLLVNMDSQAPNPAVEEWLQKATIFSKDARIRREVRYGASRFDFYIEDGTRRIFLEVKGVTLEQAGHVSFPDAPTERGVKHVEELIRCMEDGYEAYVLFVIQMKGVDDFAPNDDNHPQFGDALRKAEKAGVKIIAMDCIVTEDGMVIDEPVPVRL